MKNCNCYLLRGNLRTNLTLIKYSYVKRHAINLKINRMCLKNICYCIDSSHNATYEANYQVNMQGKSGVHDA